MNPELLTALLRACNDGVVPAPYPGEDMDAYKYRAALAGAVVAAGWSQQAAAAKDAAEQKEQARAALDAPEDTGWTFAENTKAERHEFSGAALGGGRPDDVIVTSPVSAQNPVRYAARNGALRTPGQDGAVDEIGVD